jgi:ADP-ribose pyrophosphatase YjhB (NUDIX family)
MTRIVTTPLQAPAQETEAEPEPGTARGSVSRVIDACYRVAFRLAYPLARLWWRLRGNTGITLAVWVGDRVLLVRHSYKPGLRLPGGSVRSGEDPCLAAARELQEEVGLAVAVNDLHLVSRFQNTYGTNYLYEIELTVEPKLTVDRREIVSARFALPEVALVRNQRLRSYLQARRVVRVPLSAALDLTPEEYQQRGNAADTMRRELVRRVREP